MSSTNTSHIKQKKEPASTEKKEEFDKYFNDRLSNIIYKTNFNKLNENNKKTIRNHITEIAGKLFGLYYFNQDFIYESESKVINKFL